MHVVGSHMCGRMPSAHSQHSAGEGVETVAHSSYCYGSVTRAPYKALLHLTRAHYSAAYLLYSSVFLWKKRIFGRTLRKFLQFVWKKQNGVASKKETG